MSQPPAPQASAAPLLELRGLEVAFRAGRAPPVEAVRGVGFSVAPRSAVALVGESGSGKSVSAMSIVRLLPDNAVVGAGGRALFDGIDLLHAPLEQVRRLRGKDISVVFQEPQTSLNPVFTVGDQVAEALRLHTSLTRRQARARAQELLAEVGIPQPRERMHAFPHELSGGQQQRVMIAAAIACEPRLLIADEPTTALDVTVQRQIIDLLRRLQQRLGMSVLFISHDLGLVGEFADSVVVMRHGVVRESGTAERIFGDPQDPYTRALIACRPRLDQRPRRLPVIEDYLAAGAPAPGSEQRAPRPDRGPPILQVRGLRKEFRLKTGLFTRRAIEAVAGASFTLGSGRTLGVVGESGSGKTTLARMLMRLVDASAGEVLVDGTDVLALDRRSLFAFRRKVQLIFQNPYASLNPRFTVGQILNEPMRIHGIGAGAAGRNTRIAGLLDRVGLPRASMHRYPHEFSGGQRQRIAIARALTLQPELLICDEAVSALDVSVQANVLNLLLDLQDEFGMSYVFISHDLAVVKYMADEILVMSEGRIVEQGGADEVYARPRHEYTQRLLQAIPRGYVPAGAGPAALAAQGGAHGPASPPPP